MNIGNWFLGITGRSYKKTRFHEAPLGLTKFISENRCNTDFLQNTKGGWRNKKQRESIDSQIMRS